ncbi:hypothetical protein V6N13_125014 [Hibiscus sabdariffa]|uniref:Uncharacterized protein n=1 Tax=Hibiscus sabdariffa TaxID=183260 RepID=A0ABR2U4T0_9ROSI
MLFSLRALRSLLLLLNAIVFLAAFPVPENKTRLRDQFQGESGEGRQTREAEEIRVVFFGDYGEGSGGYVATQKRDYGIGP